jgi:hypothetical protein
VIATVAHLLESCMGRAGSPEAASRRASCRPRPAGEPRRRGMAQPESKTATPPQTRLATLCETSA